MKNRIFTQAIPFILLFILSLAFLWPGSMTEDSIVSLALAKSGDYYSHIPAVFIFTWQIFLGAFDGPVGMLIFQLALFFTAVFLFDLSVHKKDYPIWIKYYYLGLYFLPSLWVSIGYIWKDLYFTFGFLSVSAFLIFKYLNNSKISYLTFICIQFSLVYFAAFKYQSRFILIFPIWLSVYLLLNYRKRYFSLILAIGISLTTVFITDSLQSIVHKGESESHSWQYVKFYDLAGMSVFSNEMLVPKIFLKRDNIEVNDIKKKYSNLWEPLIAEKDSPLRKTQTHDERELLLKAWHRTVITHPISYLQHRWKVFFKPLMVLMLRDT